MKNKVEITEEDVNNALKDLPNLTEFKPLVEILTQKDVDKKEK